MVTLVVNHKLYLLHVLHSPWNVVTAVGAGEPPSTILIDGVPVEGVEVIHLGSKQSSNGNCQPDVPRRIGLACSVMNSLQRVWKCSSLSINIKVHLQQAPVMSVLLYDTEIWTLLAADVKTLEAFHMRCQETDT